MMKIEKLRNAIQHYSWGTVDYIPNLLGINNDDRIPFAELWMGDHPRGVSVIDTGTGEISLKEYISRFPEKALGKEIAAMYGDALPFLFKVLSAASPLSIQAHPNKSQALEGFRRENKMGIPLDAFHRNYRDDNHKPEIICALTPFTAMCGFRRREKIDELFSKTESSIYTKYLKALLSSGKPDSLRTFFTAYMNLDPPVLGRLIEEVLSGVKNDIMLESRLITEFHALKGTDPGVLAPFFLNIFELKPGEALFQGPGELHAYVRGTGIELMANSDNVLRGGMTSKNIDKEELLKILTYKEDTPVLLKGIETSPCVFQYKTPVKEFVLRRLELENDCPVSLGNSCSAQIFLSISGKGTFHTDGETLSFSKGESFFLPAFLKECTVMGNGECFVASAAEAEKADVL